jgi:hypothetical protein
MYDILTVLRSLFTRNRDVVAAVISLGIALATIGTLFVVFDSVILRPLPLNRATSFTVLSVSDHAGQYDVVSLSLLSRLRERRDLFDGVAGYSGSGRVSIQLGPLTGRATLDFVTGDFFGTLGIAPEHGRLLDPADDTPDRAAVVVISDRFWRDRLSTMSDVIGRAINIEGRAFTIVGVAQPSYRGLTAGTYTDVTVPVRALPILVGQALDDESLWVNHAIAVLKSGVSRRHASDQIGAEWRAILRATVPHSATESDRQLYLRRTIHVTDGSTGVSQLRDNYLPILYAALGTGIGVIALAALNVSALMLARTIARRAQLRSRMMLGATPRHVAMLVCAEVVVAVAVSALLGSALQTGLVAMLDRALSDSAEGLFVGLAPSWRSWTAFLLLSLGISIVALCVPVAVVMRQWPLVETSHRVTGRIAAYSRLIVITQMAVAVALTSYALTSAISVHRLRSSVLRPAEDQIIVAPVILERGRATHSSIAALQAAVSRAPGIEKIALTSAEPAVGAETLRARPYRTGAAGDPTDLYTIAVSPEFFDIYTVPAVRGRV